MHIQLTTTPDAAPFDVLDVSVQTRRRANQSWLSVQVRGRRGQQADQQWQLPGLSWYDAHQLRQFISRMTRPGQVGPCRVELADAGVLLVGASILEVNSGNELAGRLPNRFVGNRRELARTIRVEPLPGADRLFTPFVLSGSRADISHHAGRLSARMWEAFLQQ